MANYLSKQNLEMLESLPKGDLPIKPITSDELFQYEHIKSFNHIKNLILSNDLEHAQTIIENLSDKQKKSLKIYLINNIGTAPSLSDSERIETLDKAMPMFKMACYKRLSKKYGF